MLSIFSLVCFKLNLCYAMIALLSILLSMKNFRICIGFIGYLWLYIVYFGSLVIFFRLSLVKIRNRTDFNTVSGLSGF